MSYLVFALLRAKGSTNSRGAPKPKPGNEFLCAASVIKAVLSLKQRFAFRAYLIAIHPYAWQDKQSFLRAAWPVMQSFKQPVLLWAMHLVASRSFPASLTTMRRTHLTSSLNQHWARGPLTFRNAAFTNTSSQAHWLGVLLSPQQACSGRQTAQSSGSTSLLNCLPKLDKQCGNSDGGLELQSRHSLARLSHCTGGRFGRSK